MSSLRLFERSLGDEPKKSDLGLLKKNQLHFFSSRKKYLKTLFYGLDNIAISLVYPLYLTDECRHAKTSFQGVASLSK